MYIFIERGISLIYNTWLVRKLRCATKILYKCLSHVITQIGMFTSILQKSMKVRVRREEALCPRDTPRMRQRVRNNVQLRSRWNLVSIVIRRMPEERSLKSSRVYIHSARFAPRRVSITPPAFAKILQKANVNS